MTTPSPISDQAAGEREAFEAMLREGDFGSNATVRQGDGYKYSTIDDMWNGWKMRSLSTAPTTGSAPVAESEIRDVITRLAPTAKFAGNHGDRQAATDAIRMLATLGDAIAVIAAPASPAAGVLTDELIDDLAREHRIFVTKGTECIFHSVNTLKKIRAFSRDLLAASIGGDRT